MNMLISHNLLNNINRYEKEFCEIKTYLEKLIQKDDEDIFNPFCAACGIEKKYHKFAWHLLALEMKLTSLSILWYIDKKPEYAAQAKKILSYLSDLPYWSDRYRKNTRITNIHPETVAVMRAFSFSLVFFNDFFDQDFLIKLKKRLALTCERLYEIIINKEDIHISDPTKDINVDLGSALGICSIVLKDFDDRWENWKESGKNIVRNFLANLPQDGSYREGLLRWEYTVFSSEILIDALETLGENTDEFTKHMERTKYYALSCSAPMCSNTSQFDQNLHIKIYNPLNGILSKMLAKRFNDPYINWGIKISPKKNYYHPLEIFYADSNNPSEIPAISSVYYPDAGKAFMRSGWGEKDNLITLKSSKIHKHHSHKDQNNMEIFIGNTEMLIESGTCYLNHPNYEMRYSGTHAHNVILIDNKPQLPIYNTKKVINFYTENNYDLLQSDASSAYSKAKIYKRNILFIKPDILVVYDYVLLTSSGCVEWLWHTPGKFLVNSLSEMKTILFSNAGKSMSMFILSPENWSYRLTKDFVLENWENMHEKTHDVLRIKSTYRNEIDFLSVFCLRSNDCDNFPGSFSGKNLYISYKNNDYNISYEKGSLIINS